MLVILPISTFYPNFALNWVKNFRHARIGQKIGLYLDLRFYGYSLNSQSPNSKFAFTLGKPFQACRKGQKFD